MKICVINDNVKKIKMWIEFLDGKLTTFHHPSFFFHHAGKTNEKFDLVILDRIFADHDVLEEKTTKSIKAIYPDIKIFLSSALHLEGESIDGFDAVIDHWPLNLAEIKEKLETIQCV